MITIGTSPKLIAAVVAAVLAYLLGQTLLDLPAVVQVILQGGLVGLGAWFASPGEVVPVAGGDGPDEEISSYS